MSKSSFHSDRSSDDDYSNDKLETHPFIENGNYTLKGQRRRCLTLNGSNIPWMLSTAVFALLLLSQVFWNLRSRNNDIRAKFGSFEHGYKTELELPATQIEIEQVMFTGGIFYSDNGTLFRSIAPGQPQYVGEPSPEIDAAWKELIHDRYVAFNSDEVKKSVSDFAAHDDVTNGIRVGIDSLHTLHCLNKLRMAIDSDYYHDERNEGHNWRLHVEHCIDYIRQIIQCSADLTPLPIIFSEGANRFVPHFEQMHTCRNYGKLRQWATEQDKKTHTRLRHGDVVG